MLTFLELYQTLLGFVFFKLYTDVGLIYPPPLDARKDETGAGVGAFSLQEAARHAAPVVSGTKVVEVEGKKVSGKDVRQTIKRIPVPSESNDADADMPNTDSLPNDIEEEFVAQPSTSDPQATTSLPTLKSLSALPLSLSTTLFSPYTFFLSRETSRPIFEFIVRSFGGRIGWPTSSGSGSPFDETEDSITHVIIDRPSIEKANETPDERERRLRRKFVQPQWVVDCINAGKILLEEPYGQGKTLPPHLSPFGEYEGAYDPTVGLTGEIASGAEAHHSEESEDEDMEGSDADDAGEPRADEIALKATAAAAEDPAALRTAELTAEAAGVDYGTFEKEVSKSRRKSKTTEGLAEDKDHDMNKMMMSNKQKKLYEKMKYSQKKRATEVRSLHFAGVDEMRLILCPSDPNWKRGKKISTNRKNVRLRLELSRLDTRLSYLSYLCDFPC